MSAAHDRTMAGTLEHHATTRGDATAFVGDTASLTYAELDRLSGRLAAGLAAQGVSRGDRVAVLLANDWPLLTTWMACARGGFVFVPVNPALRAAELGVLATSARPSILLTTEDRRADAEAVARAAGTTIVTVAATAAASPSLDALLAEPDDAAVHSPAGSPATAAPGPDALVTMLHTSGTTGVPKGVVHDHRFWNSFATHGYAEPFDFGPHTRYLSVMPLFHVNGLGFAWSVLHHGGALVQVERFSTTAYWRQVREYGANGSFIISAMASMLLAQPASPEDREHDIRLMGTSALVPDKTVEFEERFGVTLLSSYGMTEGGGCVETPTRRRLGSAGTPTSGVTLRLVTDDGSPAPPSTPGRIEMRDVAAGLAVGYWSPEQGTVEPIREAGWFATTDFGQFDDDGFLFFVARVRDRIRRAGENISAVEVEDALKSHPVIVEAAVLGVPDDTVDEELKAFVEFAAGEELEVDEVAEWLSKRLAPFKVPRYWQVVTSFPRTPTQRVKKHELGRETSAEGVVDRGRRGART